MKGSVTIVMYHYVRHLRASRYPRIKGLDAPLFEKQLDHITQNYTVITAEEMIMAAKGGAPLPSKSALLTFDDGYSDHFNYVFPTLDKRGLQGSFFPLVASTLNERVLDVNKIHFILASSGETSQLLAAVFKELDTMRKEFDLQDNDAYYEKLAVPGRFDPPEIIFIKRLLQVELPPPVRSIIVHRLFQRFVGVEEAAMSRELYMNKSQLECMQRHGMFVGAHGLTHEWLGSLSAAEQEREINASIELLESIGALGQGWAMCYPYGDYNDDTIRILHRMKCSFGLTTRVGVADPDRHGWLELPRVDTNDLPPIGRGVLQEVDA